MKTHWLWLAALAAVSGSAGAQDVYGGLGLPGLYTLGYAHPISASLGLRGEFAGGLSVTRDGNQDGVNYTGSVKANRVGVFADWYPLGGGFRLVGGLTANDIKPVQRPDPVEKPLVLTLERDIAKPTDLDAIRDILWQNPGRRRVVLRITGGEGKPVRLVLPEEFRINKEAEAKLGEWMVGK